jgi:phosphoribosylformimino-5-aminoimidazole carboxamide ribonucleotide (ProFAR) isomerase
MDIIPAIDLKGGKCVRLFQGRRDRGTVFSDRPWEVAQRWKDEGAQRLHVVDLDGAFFGRPIHEREIERIVTSVDIPTQVGGGMRDLGPWPNDSRISSARPAPPFRLRLWSVSMRGMGGWPLRDGRK